MVFLTRMQNVLWFFAWFLTFLVLPYPGDIDLLSWAFMGLGSVMFRSFLISTINNNAVQIFESYNSLKKLCLSSLSRFSDNNLCVIFV